MFFHSFISISGFALFSHWNSPHHGRHKTVKIKDLMFGIIKKYITIPDWVIVENIIPPAPRLIITFLGMIFSTITLSENVIFI